MERIRGCLTADTGTADTRTAETGTAETGTADTATADTGTAVLLINVTTRTVYFATSAIIT